MKVIQVSDDSVAQRAGVRVGDVLLHLDDSKLDSSIALRKQIAGYDWGRQRRIAVRARRTRCKSLDLHFRRAPAEPDN